jgi:hypothetical protein
MKLIKTKTTKKRVFTKKKKRVAYSTLLPFSLPKQTKNISQKPLGENSTKLSLSISSEVNR